MTNTEKISIIIVCLNRESTIEKTITSVISQSYPNLEFVVIDGQSTDETINIITRYKDKISYFVSEPDNGIYHAMNKGIKAATGDVLFFLNSDDYLVDTDVVCGVMNIFNEKSNIDIVFGNVVYDFGDYKKNIKQTEFVDRSLLIQQTIYHQTLFARRCVFQDVGGFSEGYKVVSDHEWMIKVFLLSNYNYRYINRDISICSTGGINAKFDYRDELMAMLKNYFSPYEIYRYWPIFPQTRAKLKKIIPAMKRRYPVTQKWINFIKGCISIK